MSGGISSSGANAIDHSIDTLQLEQYDYVEEVRLNWFQILKLFSD